MKLKSIIGACMLALGVACLAAGIYTIAVTGIGSPGGMVTGNVVISAVPESGSCAMLLAGLGIGGFVAARRSRSS